jgi:hypothetical protein
MNNRINHPLRLATGSHQAGSGKGCAMNVISWENGDTTITDMPACTDRFLARVVQRVNDMICTHRAGDMLCPECSIKVLALAHRTVGTGGDTSPGRRRVWVLLACEEAESVLPIFEARFPDDDRPRKAIEAARTGNAAYASNAAYAAAAYDAAYAASDAADAANDAANDAAAAAAADAASNAAYAAYDAAASNVAAYDASYAAYAAAAAAAADAANDAAYAAYAASNTAYAAYASNAANDAAYAAAAANDAAYAASNTASAVRLTRAHNIINRFYTLTGLDEHTTPANVTATAITRMLTTMT